MPEKQILFSGVAEILNQGGYLLKMSFEGEEVKRVISSGSYPENVLNEILRQIVDPANNCLASKEEIELVGHRLIHGGEHGESCSVVDSQLIEYMEKSVSLAPLHYPANLSGIKTMKRLLPSAGHYGVFDTAFHQTMPPEAYLYGISKEWYTGYKIRRYGFHGTSHKYALERGCRLAGISPESSKVITCHLGNGASVTAIRNGKSIDTSMGMTPVEGLMMGTRSGDIDAGVLIYLQKYVGKNMDEIQEIVNIEGGLQGLSGVSADYRKVEKAALKGNRDARLALKVFHYRVKKYIGAYMAVLGGLDLLVFTGGIGENSPAARSEICNGLEFSGIEIDNNLNQKSVATEALICKTGSKVRVAVIPSNEEIMIAQEVYSLVNQK